jgi:outer membrane protein assembly factor BamB
LPSAGYYYLRCDHTDFGQPSAKNRLIPDPENPNLLKLTFDVTKAWALAAGSPCELNLTPALNGWGSWHRNFSVPGDRLNHPSSAALVELPTGTAKTFRVYFPKTGRYTATLNLAQGTLSHGEGTLPPGAVAWEVPGIPVLGAQLPGESGPALYAIVRDGRTASTLARVDRATGNRLWTRGFTGSVSLSADCARADRVIAISDGQLTALNSVTGEVLWVTSNEGNSAPRYAWAGCPSPDTIITSAALGPDLWSFGAMNALDGTPRWAVRSLQWAEFKGLIASDASPRPSGALFEIRSSTALSTFMAYQVYAGAPTKIWQLRMSDHALATVVDPKQVYFQNSSSLRRTDAASGATLWTRVVDANARRWPDIRHNRVYIAGLNIIEQLSPSDGRTLWRFDSKTPSQEYWGTPLPSGDISVLPSYNQSTPTTRARLVSGGGGGRAGGSIIFDVNYPEYSLLNEYFGAYYIESRDALPPRRAKHRRDALEDRARRASVTTLRRLR